MSPVGAIFVPFPPKTGTNMLHPLPPQSLNLSGITSILAAVLTLPQTNPTDAVTRSHTSPHPIVELSDDCYHLRWYSDTSEHVHSTVRYAFWRSMKHMKRGNPAFRPISCSLRATNMMFVVERSGRNPYCSSGNRFKENLTRV